MSASEMLDERAERAVAGTLLLDPSLVPMLRGIVRAEDFSRREYGIVWAACVAVLDRGEPLDVVTLKAELQTRGQWTSLSGTGIIGDVGDDYMDTLTLRDVEVHARIVARYGAIRRVDAALATARRGLRGSDPMTVLARIGEMLRTESDTVTASGGLRPASEHIDRAVDMVEQSASGRMTVIPTGLPCLDGDRDRRGLLGGFYPGQLVVMAGAQKGGKTTLLLQMLRSAARAGHRVALWSQEMDGSELLLRSAALAAGTSTGAVFNGRLDDATMNSVCMEAEDWRQLPVEIADPGDVTIDDIVGTVLGRTRDPLRVVAIDYLGLLRHAPEVARREAHEQVGYITRAAKMLARRAKCVVILLAQVTREGNKREGKITMHDLKGGGSIESDADVVLIVQKGNDELVNTVLEVAATRSGCTGEQAMRFEKDRGRFVEVNRPVASNVRAFPVPTRSVLDDADDMPVALWGDAE